MCIDGWGLFLDNGIGRQHPAGRNRGEERGGKVVMRAGSLAGWKSMGLKVCVKQRWGREEGMES